MAEYIEREAVLKIIADNCPHDKCGCNTEEEMGAGAACYYIRKDVDNIPDADVVPKSEVEKWKEINEQLYREMSERISEERKIERKLVAREIFEEIEGLITNQCLMLKDERGVEGYVKASVHYALAELKKKYTESEGTK